MHFFVPVPKAEAKKGNFSLFDDWNKNWETIAPISFLYERDTNRSKEISKELYKFYHHDKPISVDNLQGIADVSRIGKYFIFLYLKLEFNFKL